VQHKSDDHFWFTFFHEAAHVLLHSKKNIQKAKDAWEKSFEKKVETELSDLNEMSLIHLEEEFSNYKELYPRE
jgi:Zn-dependent peptidase ImmA (M78 family)